MRPPIVNWRKEKQALTDDFRSLLNRAHAWIERGQAAGWLSAEDAARVASVESRRPGDLVKGGSARPLVVALFGGTGVGKSSLLNRIAGEAIARVGVERPTSREVTLYLHASIELSDLPPELPLDRMEIRRHHHDGSRDVLWIDAPDIDSAEETNRRCALAWLPHTHLVCYVVSPERYKDDAGWRILRERGDRHGWMFIINRWDEGQAVQRDDFARLLREAGFEAPLIAVTSCAGDRRATPTPDELDSIHRRIARLMNEHGVAVLNQQAERARLCDLREALRASSARLGDDASWTQIREAAAFDWSRAAHMIQQSSIPAVQVAAHRIAVRAPTMARRIAHATLALRGQDAAPLMSDREDTALLAADLWDEASANRLVSCLDAVEVRARQSGITAAPLRARLDTLARKADGDMGRWIGALTEANPTLSASGPRRWIQSALRWSARLLPLGGLLVVAYAVIVGYWRASLGKTPYFGAEFAIHSTMFVLLLWLLPALLERWLRPSAEQAAREAVAAALTGALRQLGERIDERLMDARRSAGELAAEGAALNSEIDRRIDQISPERSELVGGLLASPMPGFRRAHAEMTHLSR